MLNVDALAAENALTRKTQSVTRDKARGQLIIVESVAQTAKTDQGIVPIREEIHYYIAPEEMCPNEALTNAKRTATLAYLGMVDKETATTNVTPIRKVEKAEAVGEVKTADPVTETVDDQVDEVKEEIATKDQETAPVKKASRKKATRKKAATKKATAKKVVKKQEPEPEPEIDIDLDDVETETEELKVVTFDKTERTHRALLSPVIAEVLGNDWKSDDNNKRKVSGLLTSLNGNVPCCTEDGEAVPEFKKKVAELLCA